MSLRLLFRVCVVAIAVGGLWPVSPVSADPARPGNTVSVVESLTPPAPGVTVDIVGGDAFLRVRAAPGVEVRVPGYLGEPYLWIRSDGTVWRNSSSPATALNEDRYITGAAPDVSTRPGTPLPDPLWEPYGDGGEVLWHDHRVHWMGTDLPPTIDPDGLVQRWEVPLVVDGVDVMVSGALRRLDGASVLWWSWALVAAALLAVVARRWRRAVPVGAALVGLATAVVAWWAWWVLPAAARSVPAFAVLATLAVVLAAGAALRPRLVLAGPAVAGSGMALLMVAWLGASGVTAAVVPGLDTAWPWRLGVVASAGAGLVALVSGAHTASRSRAPVSLEG